VSGATTNQRIALGGDETLTYTALLQRLQQAARQRDPRDRAPAAPPAPPDG
jgi:hypothetical protein